MNDIAKWFAQHRTASSSKRLKHCLSTWLICLLNSQACFSFKSLHCSLSPPLPCFVNVVRCMVSSSTFEQSTSDDGCCLDGPSGSEDVDENAQTYIDESKPPSSR